MNKNMTNYLYKKENDLSNKTFHKDGELHLELPEK